MDFMLTLSTGFLASLKRKNLTVMQNLTWVLSMSASGNKTDESCSCESWFKKYDWSLDKSWLNIGGKVDGNGERWFVLKKDLEKNILYVSQGECEELFSNGMCRCHHFVLEDIVLKTDGNFFRQ